MQANHKLHTIALSLGIATLLAAPPVLADEPPPPAAGQVEAAKAHYKRARELYDENNFRAAQVEMKRAYELSQNARLLFDLGQIHYQLQDYPAALDAFTRYLTINKGSIAPDRVQEVQKDIERLKARIGTLRITSNRPGAQIFVDDVATGVAPLAEPILVGAGRHRVSATSGGQVATPKVIDVAGADSLTVELTFAEASAGVANAPPPEQEPSRGVSPVAWVPWIITGGFAVATVVTGGLALGKSSQLSTDLTTPGVTRAQIDADRSAGKNMALAADVLLGTTIAGAVTSLVLTLTHRPTKSPEGRAISVQVGAGSVGVAGVF